jgi:MerR family transcriptional regulator, mercuric resistance operon regulatory protein
MVELTIARLARAAGVGVETVRYYQRRGLMPTPRAVSGQAFRHYSDEHLKRLRFIRRAQTAGFTLEEIGELLTLDRTSDRPRVRELAGRRLEALAGQIAELEAARKALQRLTKACSGSNVGPCPIVEAFDVES